ncbi:MAG: flagellar biosynthesis repressor FlbT [Hyphomicrobiales bacterium]|nr:flagellar biosynthesis repressor FlbT [Hyphomicrobiales bacterium]
MKPFGVGLKAGERIYVNGAVLRVDRKVVLEFLNDVHFLLEQHIMRPEQTTTPLRQLYFIAQTMLMDPPNREATRQAFETSHAALMRTFSHPGVLSALPDARAQAAAGRVFDALKTIRALFPLEDEILRAGARGAGAQKRPDEAA